MSNSTQLQALDSPLMTSSPSSQFKACKSEVKTEQKHDEPDSLEIFKSNFSEDSTPKRPRFVISDDSGRVFKMWNSSISASQSETEYGASI